jgi:phage baseplate assembly protein V
MELLGHIKGIVAEIGENATVKVRLPEYDDLITDWLPVAQSLTLGAKCYSVPRVDTQVIVLPGQGIEDAVVIGAIYSKPDPAPFEDAAIIGLVADDGVEISYDPGKSQLTIKSPKKIDIIATDIAIKAEIDIKGNITHSGNLDQTGNAKHSGNLDVGGNATVGGTAVVTGPSTLTGGAVIAGIDFTTHKHTSASPGSPTSPPEQ